MSAAPTSLHPPAKHRSRWALVATVGFLLGGSAVALLYHFDVLGGSSNMTGDGSGVSATQARHVPAFDGVELEGSNNVVIRVGGKQSVIVHADDNLLDRVTTEVRSGKLIVGNTPGNLSTKSPMWVEVEAPAVGAVALSGSGNIVVDGIAAARLAVTLPGNGTITGSGTATQLGITVSGSGSVQFTRLVASDVQAVVSGSGSVFITATRNLDASVSGSGSILYAGSPQDVTKSVTGTGAIAGS